LLCYFLFFFFFFNDTATTEIYTLSLHDALPILRLHENASGHAFSSSSGRPTVPMNPRMTTYAVAGGFSFTRPMPLSGIRGGGWSSRRPWRVMYFDVKRITVRGDD